MAHNTLIKATKELTEEDWSAWAHMRAANPALISPYFHPDYTRQIAKLRKDVKVICHYENGQAQAFLPFQGRRFARPVGSPMSDYHGIVTSAEQVTALSYEDILQNTSIGAMHFSSAVDLSALRSPQILGQQETAALDINETGDKWRETRDSSYRRHLKSTRRRIRKAEEDIGQRRFVYKSRDIDVFRQLIDWKVQKFTETGKYNVLSADWTMALIRSLWEQPSENGLRNDMHVLYFGDEIAAIDLGLTDGHVFHSWIVAYNSDFHSYAPGIQLMEGLIDAAPDLGYKRIDLGAGLDGYKKQYSTHGQIVASGLVALSGPAGQLSRAYASAERWGEKALGDIPGKLRRRYSQIAACEDHFSGRAKAMLSAVIHSRKAS